MKSKSYDKQYPNVGVDPSHYVVIYPISFQNHSAVEAYIGKNITLKIVVRAGNIYGSQNVPCTTGVFHQNIICADGDIADNIRSMYNEAIAEDKNIPW